MKTIEMLVNLAKSYDEVETEEGRIAWETLADLCEINHNKYIPIIKALWPQFTY